MRRSYVNYEGIWIVFFVLLLLCIPMQTSAGTTETSVEIPAGIRANDQSPAGTAFKLVIDHITADAPMPAQTAVLAQKDQNVSFGPIIFTKPGKYRYTVYQENRKMKDWTLDRQIYTVTVMVANDPEGSLTAKIWGAEPGTDSKCSNLLFYNQYHKTTSGNSVGHPKTGDDSRIGLWIGGCCLSLGILIAVSRIGRKKKTV